MATITSKISYTALGMAAGLLLALSIFGVKQVEAQAGSEARAVLGWRRGWREGARP